MLENPLILLPQLTECWLREWQILPERTHPFMSVKGTGGFVLSGLRVYVQRLDAYARLLTSFVASHQRRRQMGTSHDRAIR